LADVFVVFPGPPPHLQDSPQSLY